MLCAMAPSEPTGRAAQRAACGNGFLVRYTITVFLNVVAEWAVTLGGLVYAFERGGASTTGYAAIGLLVPYVFFSPLSGALAERYPPQRVRIGAMLLQTLGFSVAALAAFADLEVVVVVVPIMLAVGGTTMLGPAGAVLRPAIVRSSQELTIANLWVGYADSVSVFGGPLLAAVMLAVGGAPAVLASCAAVAATALAISLYRRPIDPPGGSDATDRAGALRLMGRELRAVRARPGVIGILTVAGGQYFLIGLLDIVIVVAAQEEFGLGPSGAGSLATALGAGAFVSGALSTVLVRRSRLAPMIAAAMVVMAIGCVVMGVVLSAVVAFIVLPIMGLARSVQALLGQVLLQRSAEPEALGSIFAMLELAAGFALLAGTIAAQLLIAAGGVRTALLGGAIYFIVLLALTGRALRYADDSADVPVVAMSLLRRVPLFEPLPRAALEVVSRSAVEVNVASGAPVITQGEPGDRFYTVADGEFDVSIDDRIVQRCRRGDSFGEIALLGDVPRAASVKATTPGSLLAIDRAPFLIAVTGHDSSRQAAWGVVQRTHGNTVAPDGPDRFARPPIDAAASTDT